jgi:DNA-binding MarR family transcriptional regulator
VIKRLLESELIEELSERPDPAHDDERRRYYRLTPFGTQVVAAETARLEEMVHAARATRLWRKART